MDIKKSTSGTTKLLSLLLVLMLTLAFVACGSKEILDEPPSPTEISNNSSTNANPEKPAKPDSSSKKKKKEDTFQIVMVGDILTHPRILQDGVTSGTYNQKDATYNYDFLFENIEDTIDNADLAIANQEIILGGKELGLFGYPAFNGPYEIGDALVNAGFDVILHASNHALDRGNNAVTNCIKFWKEEHPDIGVVGIYDNKEDYENIYVYEKNGFKISILNYTYGMNGIPLPSKNPFAVKVLDESLIRKEVSKAKEISDFVIVCPHWGTEYTHTPDSWQQKWTKLFASLNVDLVLGAHPHVIQTCETVKRDDGKDMLVYYSVGNCVNGTNEEGAGVSDRMLGEIASVTLIKDENGNISIKKYDAIPIVAHIEDIPKGSSVYYLEDYTEELSNRNQVKSQDSAFSIELLIDIWNKYSGFEEFDY